MLIHMFVASLFIVVIVIVNFIIRLSWVYMTLKFTLVVVTITILVVHQVNCCCHSLDFCVPR